MLFVSFSLCSFISGRWNSPWQSKARRYSRTVLFVNVGTPCAASIVQLSTLKSSLWRAGNSRCGCDRLNLARASMCNREISRSCGIFARIASHTVTSPFMGDTWLRSSSDLSALITACDSLVISASPFSPGRSEIIFGPVYFWPFRPSPPRGCLAGFNSFRGGCRLLRRSSMQERLLRRRKGERNEILPSNEYL